MPLPIRFAFQNSLQSVVGDHGLATSDFNEAAGLEAVNSFRARVDSGEVGFPALPLDQNTAKAVEKFAHEMQSQVESVLVLGIGGSALGAYALDTAIRGPHPVQIGVSKKCPRLVVMDNVDPGFVAATLENLNPKKTIVCVIAKSGATAE